MAAPILLLKKGDTPSMLDTKVANEVIMAINDLRDLIVSPQGYGKLVVGDEGPVILDLSPITDAILQIQNLLGIAGGTGGGSGSGSGGSTTGTGIDAEARVKITAIIAALNNRSISCNVDNTITDVIPGLPSGF